MPKSKDEDPNTYQDEINRLMEHLQDTDPDSDEYWTVLTRINEFDKINRRSSELVKTVIPALSTVASVAGIYALQQFGGIIVPKALEALSTRSPHKNN